MKTTYVYIALIVLIIGGLIVIRNSSTSVVDSKVTKYDTFAQCLTDAGAKFYGAYWCPNCTSQKKLFDNSTKIPYIECSTPNGKGQVQLCIDEKITGYPTWKFSDGIILDGTQSLEQLAEQTKCELPQK